MEEGSEVTEDIVFRGAEFAVKIEVDKGLLIVEISDSMTADQWRGEFNPACKYHTFIINVITNLHSCFFFPADIEDLTRKTGNFKQFPIFCSMLESAVRKVWFQSYSDVEKYRGGSKSSRVNRDTNRHKFAPGCVSWAIIQSCLIPSLFYINVHKQQPKVEGLEENGRNYWNFGHISKPFSSKEWCTHVLFHHITDLS